MTPMAPMAPMAPMPEILTLLALTALLATLGAGATGAQQAAPRPESAPAAAATADEAGAEQVRQALARRAGGDLAGAIAELEAVRREPDPPALVLEALGSLYLQAERPADALAVLAPRAAVADPDPVVLFNAARAAQALGRTEEAERYLTTAVARAPVSRAALLLWELLARQQRHREAAAVLAPLATEPTASEIERVDPDLAADVALQYARASIATGAQAAAIAPLQRRTRMRPDEEESWRLLGDALLDAERFDEAREALARAQALAEGRRRTELDERAQSPDAGLGFDALMERATALRGSGDLEGALAAITSAVKLAPRDPRPRMLQVQLLLTLGRADEALPQAEGLVDLAGGHPWALYLRGMTRLAAGDPAGAEPDLRRALELAPDQVPAMNGLATLLMARGDLAEAERLSRRVLELAPGNPLATRNLEEIEVRKKKPG